MPETTKEDALRYIDAWGRDKTAENIAFYMNALNFLAQKHYPDLFNTGMNGMAIASLQMRNAGKLGG